MIIHFFPSEDSIQNYLDPYLLSCKINRSIRIIITIVNTNRYRHPDLFSNVVFLQLLRRMESRRQIGIGFILKNFSTIPIKEFS